MLKKLFSHLGEFKKSAMISPIFIGLEVIFEMLIPTLMAVIIDSGLNGNDGKGDMKFIVIMGLVTFGVAMLSLFCGIRASKYASYASAGSFDLFTISFNAARFAAYLATILALLTSRATIDSFAISVIYFLRF